MTTISIQEKHIGKEASRFFFKKLKSADDYLEQVVLRVEIVERQSC